MRQRKQIPRSATGFSDGKRHRGGARDDSNLIVDSVELTDLFIRRLDKVGRNAIKTSKWSFRGWLQTSASPPFGGREPQPSSAATNDPHSLSKTQANRNPGSFPQSHVNGSLQATRFPDNSLIIF